MDGEHVPWRITDFSPHDRTESDMSIHIPDETPKSADISDIRSYLVIDTPLPGADVSERDALTPKSQCRTRMEGL